MNKFKYEDKKIRQEINKYANNIQEIEQIISCVVSYYNISRPVIIDYSISYDGLDITLISKNNEKEYKISFDFSYPMFFDVKQPDKSYYETFQMNENKLYLSEKTFVNLKKKIRFTKIYSSDNENSFNNKLFHEFEYYYQNRFLNSEIKIRISKTMVFSEENLIRNILNDENINSINDLYALFITILKTKELNIYIVNKVDGYLEKLFINNGELKEYKRCIKKNGEVEYLKYDGNQLWITKMVDETTNQSIKEIKKLIK